MGIRRALALASVLLGLLASGPAGAVETYAMDGKRRTVQRYAARLTETAVPLQSVTRAQLAPPLLADCTPASCDIRELRLALPKGTTVGRFTASAVVPRTMAATLAVYDAKGALVDYHDALWFGGMSPCCALMNYTLSVYQERLRAGRYTIALIDRGGSGDVQATVGWVAHPPDRRR